MRDFTRQIRNRMSGLIPPWPNFGVLDICTRSRALQGPEDEWVAAAVSGLLRRTIKIVLPMYEYPLLRLSQQQLLKRNPALPPFLVALQAGSASAADWAGLQGAPPVGRSLLARLSTFGYTELLPFQHLIFNPHSGRREHLNLANMSST